MNDGSTTVAPGPIIQDVVINHSGAYGLQVSFNEEDDPTPPILQSLSISNSMRAPILMDAAAVGGLGTSHRFDQNGENYIEIGTGLNSGIFFSQSWRAHDIPYYLPEGLYVRDNNPNVDYTTFTLEPGVTLLVGEDENITIGSLYGDAKLIAEGTVNQPISMTRLNETSGNWGSLRFDAYNATKHHLQYVNLLHAGTSSSGTITNPLNSTAAIHFGGSGSLNAEYLAIKHSKNGAIYQSNGYISLVDGPDCG